MGSMVTVRTRRRDLELISEEVERNPLLSHSTHARWRAAVELALRARPPSAAKSEKRAKKASKRGETAAIREACEKRAEGFCECGCGIPLTGPGRRAELDHFFGRRVPQSVRTCWLLTYQCHWEKTDNSPSAAYWLRRFIAHCGKHGYAEEISRASDRLAFVQVRAELGRATP